VLSSGAWGRAARGRWLVSLGLAACLAGCTFPVHKVPESELRQRVAPAGPRASPSPASPDAPALPGGPPAGEDAAPGPGEDAGPWQAAAPLPPDEPLTLRQSIACAIKHNPRLRVLRERVLQARSGKEIAFSAFLPEASISYRALFGSREFVLPTLPSSVGNMAFGESASRFQSAELNLQWVVWDFGRSPGLFQQARALEEVAQLQFRRGVQTVAFNTAAAYFDLLQKRALCRVADESVVRARAFLRDARNYVEQGTAVVDDALQAELLLAEMQLGVVSARTERTVALASLNRAMGLHVSSVTQIEDDTAEPPFSLSLDDCLEAAVAFRDEFQVVLRLIGSSQWGRAAAQARFLPVILAGGTGAHHEGHGDNDADFLAGGVRIELALFEGARRCAELGKSSAEVRMALAQAEEVADTIAFEVVAARAGLDEARQRIEYSRAAVKWGTENLAVLVRQFRRGDATSTDVIDAEWALLRAQESFYGALYGYRIALARLAYAVGTIDENRQAPLSAAEGPEAREGTARGSEDPSVR